VTVDADAIPLAGDGAEHRVSLVMGEAVALKAGASESASATW
jgi:hypothetical protein